MIGEIEIQDAVKKIVQNYKPEKIYLFGSFAWGNPTKDSDVDLFLVKKTNERQIDRQREVRKILNGELPVDLLVYTPEEVERRLDLGDFFIEDIVQKGKLIYESAR